jgi:glycosyltransferase involved in cell wall biosynthesis
LSQPKIAVVIPAYRVLKHIDEVLASIPQTVSYIFVTDDACPEQSGKHVEATCQDPRVKVLFHQVNQGVGGAVMTGYLAALETDAKIVVKVDGDGQMDLAQLPRLIAPIVAGKADYTKGNRFNSVEALEKMPRVRIFGNAVLSLMNKFASGLWHITDPTNGYTAIHTDVLRELSFVKISKGYFFESDLLFRLSLLRAVVLDVPMNAVYDDEESNLKISKIIPKFLRGNTVNWYKRIFYQYYLREWSAASFELPLGLLMVIFGFVSAIVTWITGIGKTTPAPAGTVMLAALPLIVGIQLLLAFINFDVESAPRSPRHLEN